MQAPIGKSIKTHGLALHGASISSRIREVRENLCCALQPVGVRTYLELCARAREVRVLRVLSTVVCRAIKLAWR